MNQRIKRFFTACTFAFAALSCSYAPVEIPQGTRISIQVDMESIKGTQASMAFIPEDDRVYYMGAIVSVEEYNDTLKAYDGNAANVINAALKDMYKEYVKDWKELYDDHAYKAPFKNAKLIYGKSSHLAVGLTPQTDYYALAYCVDCVNDSTFRIKGDLFKQKFTTTEVQTYLSKMKLEYMVHDTDDGMYMYTKPTYTGYDIQHDGKICRDRYFVDMISKKDLDKQFGGNPFAFAGAYYMEHLTRGDLNNVLCSDISRKEYDMTDAEEGDHFYIIGAPYNITNLNRLYVLEITYTRKMKTRYESELIFNDMTE